jgi:hypothetical protein
VNDDRPGTGVALLPLAAAAVGCGSNSAQNKSKPAPRSDESRANSAKTSPPRPKLTPAQTSLTTATSYLFQKQQDDGSWPSDYKQLEGAAMTSLVLYALGQTPTEIRPPQFDQRIGCAMSYLTGGIAAKGYVVRPDGTPDYPTYATALTLIAADALDHDLAAGDREKLVRYLLAAQLTADRGFPPNHPHHGGWDMLGDPAARGVTTGTNISVTCYVLQSLRAHRRSRSQDSLVKQIDAAFDRAWVWLARCHNAGDGGFFFHPDRFDPMNKAGWEDEKNQRPRSYGTATCDGVRSLLYRGANLDDPRVVAALAWLEKHDDVKTVPGFENVPKELGWHEGLRFYYYATLAKLLDELPPEKLPKHRQALSEVVLSLQHPDGHWQNTSAAMREDDPILATSFAIIALSS